MVFVNQRNNTKKKEWRTHIFVTARNGDIAIIPLSAHDSLNAISNQIPRLQTVAHTPSPHGDSITDADGVEPEADHSGLDDPLFHGLRETQQVHVASIPLVPDGGYADLGLGHVILGEAHAVQNGLRATL